MIPIPPRPGSLPPAGHYPTTMRLLQLITSTLLFRNRKMCPVSSLLYFCLCLLSSCGVCSGLCDPYSFFVFLHLSLNAAMRNREHNTCPASWTASSPLHLRITLSNQQRLCWPLAPWDTAPFQFLALMSFLLLALQSSSYTKLFLFSLWEILILFPRVKRVHPLPYNIVPLLGTIDKHSQHFF